MKSFSKKSMQWSQQYKAPAFQEDDINFNCS